MRLTRRGRVVFSAIVALPLIFSPFAHSDAVAPLPTVKMTNTVIWTAEMSQRHAKSRFIDYGWDKNEWACLKALWTKESNWRNKAFNRQPVYQVRDGKRVRLNAGGIPQILGLSPKTPAPIQIRKGMDYIEHRYGTPCRAWAKWKARAGKDGIGGWY